MKATGLSDGRSGTVSNLTGEEHHIISRMSICNGLMLSPCASIFHDSHDLVVHSLVGGGIQSVMTV